MKFKGCKGLSIFNRLLILFVAVFIVERWMFYTVVYLFGSDLTIQTFSLFALFDILILFAVYYFSKYIPKLIDESADAAESVKKEYFLTMSHEIRTPMNGIIGTADLLLETDITSVQRRYITLIKQSSYSLLSNLNSVGNYSKNEENTQGLKYNEFSLHNEMEKVINKFMTQSSAKGIDLKYVLDSDVPIRVNGDPDKLGQVLDNLVGNAVKFTYEGEIELKVRTGNLDYGITDILLHFSIADTGIGIPSNKLIDIFESFLKVDTLASREYSSGSGLTVSKELIYLMGGDIWVESDPGKGSTFHFTTVFGIECEYEMPESKHGLIEIAPLTSMEKVCLIQGNREDVHILLVEDNVINQKVAVHILQNEGYAVVGAFNGREALESLKKEHFDLILMDIQMPEMDGIETTREIRYSQDTCFNPNIPIVALTAHTYMEDREKCLAVGMNGFISKPFRKEDLVREIQRFVKGVSREANADIRETNTTENKEVRPYEADQTEALNRLGGDQELLDEVWETFVHEVPVQMETLKKAIQAEKYLSVEKYAHSLMSSAANIGAGFMKDRAYKIEVAGKNNELRIARILYERLEDDIVKVMGSISQADEYEQRVVSNNEITEG